MNNLPEGPRGKALALGLVFLVLVVFYLVIVSSLIGLYDSGEERLQERQAMVHRLQVTARDLPRLHKAAEELKAQAREGKLLLTGTSDTVAAAMLQTTMKDLVEKGGAKLNSAEILPSETKDRFQRVAIRVSFGGDLALLTTVLRGIETARPMIFVDNVEIRGAGGSESEGQGLTIAFDLYGFRQL